MDETTNVPAADEPMAPMPAEETTPEAPEATA